MDTGALVKDYEGPEKEIIQALQLAVSQVTFEDERYIVRVAIFDSEMILKCCVAGTRSSSNGSRISEWGTGHLLRPDRLWHGRTSHWVVKGCPRHQSRGQSNS